MFGGRSPEHEVSLVSAAAIRNAFDDGRFELVLVGVDRAGVPRVGGSGLLEGGLDRGEGVPVRWPAHPGDHRLRDAGSGEPVTEPIDVLFPIVHGLGGEDGAIQGICAFAGLPFVGAGVLGSSLAMDKDRARRVLEAEGLPVVQDVVVWDDEGGAGEVRPRVEAIGWPVFVKPARAGSSVGVTRVTGPEELGAALERARLIDRKLVIETAVPEPRELEVAVLGNREPRASVPGEIVPHGEFYDYRAKYEDPESKLLVPAPIQPDLVDRVQQLACRAFTALDLAGLARVDFLLSGTDGRLVINEVNTLPGFTEISMYPKLWDASGVPMDQLVARLVELALDEAAHAPWASRDPSRLR
jgi:D-alanine-D-alanine ligase